MPEDLLADFPNDPARIPGGKYVGWNRPGDHAARPDSHYPQWLHSDKMMRRRPPRRYCRCGWARPVPGLDAFLGVDRMIRRVYLHVGSEENIVTQMHLVAIEDDAAEIHEYIFSGVNSSRSRRRKAPECQYCVRFCRAVC